MKRLSTLIVLVVILVMGAQGVVLPLHESHLIQLGYQFESAVTGTTVGTPHPNGDQDNRDFSTENCPIHQLLMVTTFALGGLAFPVLVDSGTVESENGLVGLLVEYQTTYRPLTRAPPLMVA